MNNLVAQKPDKIVGVSDGENSEGKLIRVKREVPDVENIEGVTIQSKRGLKRAGSDVENI